MYIVYERDQREIYTLDGNIGLPRGIPSHDTEEEESDFKPSWLVRISDMKLVSGADIREEYWALSYSWNQSGEIIEIADEEYQLKDEVKHQIITYQSSAKPEGSKTLKTRKKHTDFVNFKDLIQQISKDFGIRYIWYDQMCINQNDPEEKIREIKRMHLIYRHARCTVALIPELECSSDANIDVIPGCQWSKRAWTLEEAYMSRFILFLGRNVHMWSHIANSEDALNNSNAEYYLWNICNKSVDWTASTTLWFARTRTSSKAHDRIFALANIFPELKSDITFSYKQPMLDLMIQFYVLLAQKDLSVLCFGTPLGKPETTKEPRLPSWTGGGGVHTPHMPEESEPTFPDFTDCSVTERSLHLTCSCIPVSIKNAGAVKKIAMGDDCSRYSEDGLPTYPLVVLDRDELLQIAASCSKQMTFVSTTSVSQNDHNFYTQDYGLKATHFLPVKEEKGAWINTLLEPTRIGAWLSLTEDCSECLVLSGVPFQLYYYHLLIAHPVVTKEGDHYKSIGVCFIDPGFKFDSSIATKQRITIE